MPKKKNVFADVPEHPDYRSADVVIVPAPFEKTTSYGHGTNKGPASIIDASVNVELFDDELARQTCDLIKIHTASPLNVVGSAATVIERIGKESARIARDGKFPFIIGGEHSISAGPVKSLKNIYPDLGVIQFDAHADLRDQFDGTKQSHAAVMRRVVECECPILQIGIRSFSEEEAPLINKGSVRTISARDIKSGKINTAGELKKLPRHIYVTLDIDVFDPAYMPATGTPEPGGLDWFEVTGWLKAIFESKAVVGMDLVELAPQKGLHAPDFLAAKLIYRSLGYLSLKTKP